MKLSIIVTHKPGGMLEPPGSLKKKKKNAILGCASGFQKLVLIVMELFQHHLGLGRLVTEDMYSSASQLLHTWNTEKIMLNVCTAD